MKIFFLLNASQPKRVWDLREAAGVVTRRHGATARFGQVDRHSPHSTDRLLRQAFEEGFRRIVIVGGDGTMHRTLNTLRRMKHLSKTELAYIPAGTCNDFAR